MTFTPRDKYFEPGMPSKKSVLVFAFILATAFLAVMVAMQLSSTDINSEEKLPSTEPISRVERCLTT